MKFNWKQALLVGTAVIASGGGIMPVSKAFAQAELIIDVNNDGTFTADGTEQFDQPINLTTTGSQDGGNNEANDRDILVNGSATIGIDADTNIGAAPGAGTQLTSGAIFTAAGAGGSTLILLNSGGSGDAETLTIRGDILRFTSNNVDQGSLNLTINGQNTGGAGDDFNVDVQGSVNLGTGVLRVSDNGGAGAVLMMTAEKAAELGVKPLARIVDSCLVGSDPELMLTGPIGATQKLLADNDLSMNDIDVVEINEAFASVVLAWEQELSPDMETVNPNGGAIALGHPLGGTGAILTTKAVHELQRTDGEYAIVTMCCGGGLGTGTLLQKL